MAQHAKPPYRPADVTYLLQELRRLSTQRDGAVAFWKVMRWHLRDRRGR